MCDAVETCVIGSVPRKPGGLRALPGGWVGGTWAGHWREFSSSPGAGGALLFGEAHTRGGGVVVLQPQGLVSNRSVVCVPPAVLRTVLDGPRQFPSRERPFPCWSLVHNMLESCCKWLSPDTWTRCFPDRLLQVPAAAGAAPGPGF